MIRICNSVLQKTKCGPTSRQRLVKALSSIYILITPSKLDMNLKAARHFRTEHLAQLGISLGARINHHHLGDTIITLLFRPVHGSQPPSLIIQSFQDKWQPSWSTEIVTNHNFAMITFHLNFVMAHGGQPQQSIKIKTVAYTLRLALYEVKPCNPPIFVYKKNCNDLPRKQSKTLPLNTIPSLFNPKHLFLLQFQHNFIISAQFYYFSSNYP